MSSVAAAAIKDAGDISPEACNGEDAIPRNDGNWERIAVEDDPWRIHGAAIYGNMDPINIPQMLAYIPYMDPMGDEWLDYPQCRRELFTLVNDTMIVHPDTCGLH